MAVRYSTSFLEPEIRLRAGFDQRGIDECWEWQRAKSDTGYGQVGIDKKVHYAHRLMYQLFYGDPDLSKADVIMHTCDNRGCV